MAPGNRQPKWNIYEAAILLAAYLEIQSREKPRSYIIKKVSDNLRQMARNNGLCIDEVYRNSNGISSQMQSMESAYKGETIKKPATKLFIEIVNIYSNDNKRYHRLLREANLMISGTKTVAYAFELKPQQKIEKDIINFTDIQSLAYTKPIRITYYGKVFDDLRSWKDAYVKLVGAIYDDYSNVFPVGKSFTGIGRIDFGNKEESTKMVSPKRVFMQMYVETNLGATDLVRKIKGLMNCCNIEYENIIIEYEYKNNEYGNVVENNKQKKNIESEEVDNTEIYMRLKSMASVYDDAKGFEIEWILSRLNMDIDLDELKSVLNEISWIAEVAPNVYSFAKNAKPFEQTIDFDKDAFVRVLMMRYQNGMRFDSIDFENFRETYDDIIGKSIEFTDRELELCLQKCGVLYEGRIFPSEGIINCGAKEKLMVYIADSFNSGKNVLYYKAIYSDLSDVFAYCFNLTDAMMLKPYLEYTCESNEYFFAEEYMSNVKNVKINHSTEIEQFLLSEGKPLSYEEIYAGLSHISRDVVNSEIRTNSNIILNEKGHYYHYGIFEFSSEDADRISGFISDDIEEEGYCIWSRVFVRIQQTMPLFVENNIYLSSIGIRNAISKKLAGRFDFDSEVICVRGQSLNMAAVYKLYGQHHAPFSDGEIYEFAREVSGKVIYFDSLSETTVRTSKNLFVPIGDISFDVEAVDNALATYLSTGYMLIRDIDSFLLFPNVGYEWNAYLLESYLMYFSEKYSLVNNGRSLNNVAGALVKKGTGFDDFLNVCADVLANSDVILSKAKALDYLADQNLLTRRIYAKIDEAISKARQIRNRKG